MWLIWLNYRFIDNLIITTFSSFGGHLEERSMEEDARNSIEKRFLIALLKVIFIQSLL